MHIQLLHGNTSQRNLETSELASHERLRIVLHIYTMKAGARKLADRTIFDSVSEKALMKRVQRLNI